MGMGGGDQPSTPPPNFNKPTPASHPIIIETYTAAPKTEDGSSDDQSSMHSSQRESLPTDDGNYQPQSPRSSLHSDDSNMDQSFVDPCVLNRGPRLHSTSSFLYPIQCPQVLANDLPIHPSTHFVRREDCTVERIGEYEQNLRENREAIYDLTNYISIHRSYHRIQENARDSAFEVICKAAAKNPTASFNSPENIARTRAMCAIQMENSFSYILDLERRLAIFQLLEVRNAAEISAMRFGYNYVRQHPSDEFVIFVMEEGHILQRVNPFIPSRFSGPRDEEPENPEDHVPTPKPESPRRFPRNNILTNQLNSPQPNFDVVHIDHAFEMTKYFNKKRNILIVYPNDSKIFKSLTKTMDNNIAIIHDAIKKYYTSGKYEQQLKNMTGEYFKFTNQLELSHIDFDFKKHYIFELDDYIRQKLDGNMLWFYDTYNCIEDVKTKISNMFKRLFATKI